MAKPLTGVVTVLVTVSCRTLFVVWFELAVVLDPLAGSELARRICG